MDNQIHAIKVDNVIQSSQPTKHSYDTIVFSNGEIIDIGNQRNLEKLYSFDTFIEHEKAIIIPGLINTHTHSIQTFFRGKAENLQLIDWLYKVILPGEANLTEEEVYASSLLGFVDMVSHGTTFANDMITTHHNEKAIQAAIDIGIRTKIGKMLMDIGPDDLVDDTNIAIEETHKLIKKFHTRTPLLEYSLNPRFLVSCSPELMKACTNLLEEDQSLSLHTHACENKYEIEIVKKNHGNYIESLKKYGSLSDRSILAHGVWLDDNDISILKSTNTAVAHCPSSNSKLASGICDWPKLIDNNIPVGLGTDGPPSNNTMDLFREMRLASLLQRIKSFDETLATSHQVFDLATIKGAQALRREKDLGTLEKGKKADFVVLDISHPSNYPLYDFINHLVFKSSGEDVIKTFIEGQLVYDKKQFSFEKMFPLTPQNSISKVLNMASSYVENTSS